MQNHYLETAEHHLERGEWKAAISLLESSDPLCAPLLFESLKLQEARHFHLFGICLAWNAQYSDACRHYLSAIISLEVEEDNCSKNDSLNDIFWDVFCDLVRSQFFCIDHDDIARNYELLRQKRPPPTSELVFVKFSSLGHLLRRSINPDEYSDLIERLNHQPVSLNNYKEKLVLSINFLTINGEKLKPNEFDKASDVVNAVFFHTQHIFIREKIKFYNNIVHVRKANSSGENLSKYRNLVELVFRLYPDPGDYCDAKLIAIMLITTATNDCTSSEIFTYVDALLSLRVYSPSNMDLALRCFNRICLHLCTLQDSESIFNLSIQLFDLCICAANQNLRLKVMAIACLTDAAKYIAETEDFNRAIELIDAIRNNFQSLDHSGQLNIACAIVSGYSKTRLGQFDRALEEFEAAMNTNNFKDYFDSEANAEGAVNFLHHWINALVASHNRLKAIEISRTALSILNRAAYENSILDKFLIKGNLAYALTSIGICSSVDVYREIIEDDELRTLVENCSDPVFRANYVKILRNYGADLCQINNPIEALSHFFEAEKLVDSWGLWANVAYQWEIALLFRCIADAFLQIEDKLSAHNRFTTAFELFRSKENKNIIYDSQVFSLCLTWIRCWNCMDNPHVWAKEVSVELSRRLSEQNIANPPDWLGDLYQDFAQFHLRWMKECLKDGHPEHLVAILSRISSWRMVTAIGDELETMIPTVDGDESARVLQHYQRMRLEVRRLQQRLQEKEHPAGFRGTDFSGVRSFEIDERQLSPETQARLKGDADALRAQYDHAYTQMQLARNEATKVPGYEALAIDRHVLDSQKLLAELKDGQAILIVFDHQATGDNPDDTQQLSGALLLKDGEVHWHPIDDIAQGSAFLCEFEVLVDNKRAGGLRGSSGEDNGVGLNSLNGFEPIYGDFRRGDTPIAATQAAPPPMTYQGQTIDRENLWKLFGDWVEETIWKPLNQRGMLDGVKELALVTQGQEAHAIPWQMRAPVPNTSIRRYPGLMFYAMATKLMSRADCSNEPMMGIAHYQGVEKPLPFARIEAHILGQIWVESERTTVQEFDYLQPQVNAGYIHVAGHGTHAHNAEKQTATAGLSVGKDTYWGLAQLMNSPSRPKEVYLSCCVAGRTTDLAGEQYGVTSALLQHGTIEVVACNVPLSDIWGSALSIVTHSLMQQYKFSMREALHQAQRMVTGEREWDLAAWEWIRQAFAIRLGEMEPIGELLQKQITPLLVKLQRETASMGSDAKLAKQLGGEMRETMHFPQLSLLQFDYSKLFVWTKAVASELRTHNGQADEATLRSIVQSHTQAFRETLTWIDKAPTHIGGSLVYATMVYG